MSPGRSRTEGATPFPCEQLPGQEPQDDRPTYGIYGEFSWAFVLEETGERNTRLIVRTRASYGPRLYRALTMPFVLVGGEFLTTRKMVYGIKRRVEQTARPTPA